SGRTLLGVAARAYPFPDADEGRPYLANLRGPDYMHFMRRRVLAAGVTALDHHPALALRAAAESLCGATRGAVTARGRVSRCRRRRHRSPARPAVAHSLRRRRARDRRLRVRRAHAG